MLWNFSPLAERLISFALTHTDTGIWDSSNGIEEYTTSVISFINKCVADVVPTVTVRTYPNQKPLITGIICTELKGRASRSGTLTRKLIRNPSMPSDEPSNKKSVNTGLRSKHTISAPMLVGCGRACKLLQTTKGGTAESRQVTQAYQMSYITSMLASRQVTLKHA